MIKKLYNKLVLIISLSLGTVLVVLLVIMNGINISNRYDEAHKNLQNFVNYLGKNDWFWSSTNEDTKTIIGTNDYYVVVFDDFGNGELLQTNVMGTYTRQEIINYANNILKIGSKEGKIDHLFYQYVRMNSSQMLIFLDNHDNDNYIKNFLLFSFLFAIGGITTIVVIASYLSKWLVKPIEENFQKQKDFVSDASHELKTPLTVISANCDLLESEIGSNKWLNYIKTETDKMTKLVQELLTLSRNEKSMVMTKINVSEIVTSSVMSMESVAYEQDISLTSKIEPDLFLMGYATQIQELVTILIDNAIKYNYAKDNKKVEVELLTVKNNIILKVRNTGKAIAKENYDRIFERFYRVDEAHNRGSGQYGLGLAIAKVIVDNHKGKISVDCNAKWTTFTVIF